MEKIYSDDIKIYGNDVEQHAFLDSMSKEMKVSFVKQYLAGVIYKRPEFRDYNVDEAAQKIVNSYSNEEFYELIKNLESCVYFTKNRNASDRLILAFNSIAMANGKKSIKNAFMERYDNKSDINPLISSCISQTYKMLINYQFLITQQVFNKFIDSIDIMSDKRFKIVIDGIREQTGKLHEVSNNTVVRIIRNGIAHMNYVDNAATIECEELSDLTKNLMVKIFSKSGEEFIIVNVKFIMMLSELMLEHISKIIPTLNLSGTYYLLPDEYKREYILDKCRELIGDCSTLKPFEKEFIKICLKQNTEKILTAEGFSAMKTTVENPQYLMLEKIKKTGNLLNEINKSRNKSNNDVYKINQTVPTLSIVYLFQALSQLIDLKLVKNFVDDNMNSKALKKAFNITETTKRKSIINKFRLLRNSLAHAHILNYGYMYAFYDIDENGVKIDLGKIDFHTLLCLCEDIENYIMKYYDKFLEEYKSKVPTSKPDVM